MRAVKESKTKLTMQEAARLAQELKRWIQKHDVKMFLADKSLRYGKNEFELSTGHKITQEEFAKAVTAYAEVWMRKVGKGTKDDYLNNAGWDNLKEAVSALLPQLQGLSLEQAERVVRTRCPCNQGLLLGLPKRFHVWKQRETND